MNRAVHTRLGRIAVVGVSLAGLRAAEALRRRGFAGTLTLIGEEPHFPPFDRPPLSKEVLSGTWELAQARLRTFGDLSAQMCLGRTAVDLDLAARELRLDDGSRVEFDGLLIATGARVRRLVCPGSDLPGVHHFRVAEDCARLARQITPASRIVVIGGSFIGSEVAAVCRGIGAEVTIVDALPLPMAQQVGAMMARYLMARHEHNGIRLLLGTGVQTVEGTSTVEAVRLSDGTRVECDAVVVGIGVSPATEWLHGSELTIDNGVVCDEHCIAVGATGVAAAGDVANWVNPLYGERMRVEHWTNAVEQAEYAAHALLGERDGAGFASMPYFWSDQHDLHVQFAGRTGDQSELVDGSFDDNRFVLQTLAGGVPVGVLAVNWPAQFQRRRRALLQELRQHLVPQVG